jgi:GntR family transcriptional regulator, phosphonate transport system regulatory protein
MVVRTALQPRQSGTAVWKQIEKTLLSEIMNGSLAPGDRLPSESALAERFAVNRHTVRRALAELSAQDILQIENGRGAFVTRKALRYNVSKRIRSVESMLRDGHDMVVKVLSATRSAASIEIAAALEVQPGSVIWVIDSLSTINRKPMIHARHCFPAERFPDFYDRYKAAGSIGATLATYGVDSTRKSMVFSAQLADQRELELLKEQSPTPILSVESLYVDQHGRPVDHGVAHYAGNRIDLQID